MPDVCEDLTLRHLDKMVKECVRDEKAAIELLKDPKMFFEKRGFSVPPKAQVTVTPTKELHAGLVQKSSVRNMLTRRKKLVGHIPGGRAKCTVLVVQ